MCLKGGLTYENGETLEHGCDSICTCTNGKMDCKERCTGPFFKKGKTIEDPLCTAEEGKDPCCSILVCATGAQAHHLLGFITKTERFSEHHFQKICTYKNQTHAVGEKFDDGCESTCICENSGAISCKPRLNSWVSKPMLSTVCLFVLGVPRWRRRSTTA